MHKMGYWLSNNIRRYQIIINTIPKVSLKTTDNNTIPVLIERGN